MHETLCATTVMLLQKGKSGGAWGPSVGHTSMLAANTISVAPSRCCYHAISVRQCVMKTLAHLALVDIMSNFWALFIECYYEGCRISVYIISWCCSDGLSENLKNSGTVEERDLIGANKPQPSLYKIFDL